MRLPSLSHAYYYSAARSPFFPTHFHESPRSHERANAGISSSNASSSRASTLPDQLLPRHRPPRGAPRSDSATRPRRTPSSRSASFNLSEADLDTSFDVGTYLGGGQMKLSDILASPCAPPTATTSASNTPTSRMWTSAAGCRSDGGRAQPARFHQAPTRSASCAGCTRRSSSSVSSTPNTSARNASRSRAARP
jgi:hypothetical protein